MFEFFHKTDFTNSSRRCTFFGVQVDLFERHGLLGSSRTAFVDGGVGALTELLELDVVPVGGREEVESVSRNPQIGGTI